MLVANPRLKVAGVQELIAQAKQRKAPFNYASSGTGAFGHLTGELFKSSTGTDLAHVPYKGGGPGIGVDNWQGLFAPPALPRKIQLALDREVAEIVRSKEFSDTANHQGAEADHIGLDQFAAFVRKDHARWKQIIDRNQIRGE